jgi:hypothetical protein
MLCQATLACAMLGHTTLYYATRGALRRHAMLCHGARLGWARMS